MGELAANEPREAGLLHERAAEIHEVLAAEFERAAHAETSPVKAGVLARRAEVERNLARLTWQYAQRARHRPAAAG
ncbi:MAG: hypothetical protein ACXV3F_07510 [Frankiaceae bacterium]